MDSATMYSQHQCPPGYVDMEENKIAGEGIRLSREGEKRTCSGEDENEPHHCHARGQIFEADDFGCDWCDDLSRLRDLAVP